MDHAHAMVLDFPSILPVAGEAGANNIDRVLT